MNSLKYYLKSWTRGWKRLSHKDIETISSDDTAQELSGAQKSVLRLKISAFEGALHESDDQIEIPVFHHFGKGVYAREMRMPKGSTLVGKIHKFANVNILSQGEVSILSQDGGALRVKAPYTLVAGPGAKRVFYAHSDVVWTVMHGTVETNLEKIEDEFIAKNYDEIDGLSDGDIKKLKEAKCPGQQ